MDQRARAGVGGEEIELITREEAARLLFASPETLAQWKYRGMPRKYEGIEPLTVHAMPRGAFYDRADVLRFRAAVLELSRARAEIQRARQAERMRQRRAAGLAR